MTPTDSNRYFSFWRLVSCNGIYHWFAIRLLWLVFFFDQELVSYTATHLVVLVVIVVVAANSSKSQRPKRLRRFKWDQDEIWQGCSSGTYASIFMRMILIIRRNRIFHMTSYFQDGGHGVISRRKVLPSGKCTRSGCQAHMQQQRMYVPEYIHSYTCFIWQLTARTLAKTQETHAVTRIPHNTALFVGGICHDKVRRGGPVFRPTQTNLADGGGGENFK